MSDTRPQMKPWIAQIHAYVPGRSTGSDGRELVKLSANENPLGCSPLAAEALKGASAPALYPDPDSSALREKLSALHGIDPARIVCGTGSGELLNCAVQAFAGPGADSGADSGENAPDEIVFSRYAFSLYPLLAHKVGAQAVLAADDDYAASVDALLDAVTTRTTVVLLDNPNNPTGTYLPPAEVKRLHAGLPGHVLLVLDQAYAEYLPGEEAAHALEMAARHENVLVTRTFSKIFGLAGERIGWATGAPGLIDALNRLRGPFNVTASGQVAALAALDDAEFLERSRAHNNAERARFAESLAALGNRGIRALPSEANFVLVLFDGELDAATALDGLAKRGYAVRRLPGQGLANGLRITIGKAEDMDAIAEAIAEMAEDTSA
ncbi:pyridoxal phosphate-dependent aminotransferase [Qipengyuania sp. DSG2-2]|uniref:pyridoxal phosphate-dependent aminotransferase n=1 Tax=Qipengyuania sp. DGS2-2 TaxID=3349631 RepID=UPI0036D34DAA